MSILKGGAVSTAYNFTYFDEQRWQYFDLTDPQVQDPTTGQARTDKLPIQNNSIILSEPQYISMILFWDNSTYLGAWMPGTITDSWVLDNTDWPSNGVLTVPNNATHFALNIFKTVQTYSTYSGVTFNDFSNATVSYQSSPAIDNIYYGGAIVENHLSFDGVDDYVDIDNTSNDLSFTGSGFIEATIKTSSNVSGTQVFIQKSGFMRIRINNGDFEGDIIFPNPNRRISVFSNITIQPNTEYTVKLDFIQNGTFDIYVNGVLEGSTNVSSDGPMSTAVQENVLGAYIDAVQSMGENFEGDILYARYVNNGTTVAEYLFNEGTGTTLNDNVENNDGTIVGATWGTPTVSYPTIDRVYAGGTLVFGDPPDPFVVFTDTSGSPGNDYPINDLDGNIMADLDKGIAYYGTVSHTDLYTSDEIASAVGITQGTSINNESMWHKYYWNNGIHFWRKPVRMGASWSTIANAGAVYGTNTTTSRKGYSGTNVTQNSEVIKNGITYIVRLMEGANVDQASDNSSDMHNSEFSLILMNLHAATNSGLYSNSPTDQITYRNWTQTNSFTNNDFVGWKTNFDDNDFAVKENGQWKWQQESTTAFSNAYRILRGGNESLAETVDDNLNRTSITAYDGTQPGWCPVLTVKHSSFTYE